LRNQSPGKKPENFEKFSSFFPGPLFLAFKLFELVYLFAQQIDKQNKSFAGPKSGRGKEMGAVSKASRVFSATHNLRLPPDSRPKTLFGNFSDFQY